MAPLRSQRILNTALVGAVFLVICDRLLKAIAINVWQQSQEIISGLSLIFSKNYEVAFSIPTFINPLIVIIPITIILIFFFVSSIKKRKTDVASALLFIILGAISNLYDRIVYGYIIDYIHIQYFTVFNLADVMICVGVVWLLLNHSKTSKISQP